MKPSLEALAADAVANGRRLAVPHWRVVLKLILVLAGLAFLVHWTASALRVEGAEPLRVAPWAIIAGLSLNQAALLAAALRLRATLAAFGVHLTIAQALSIHLRSLFYFFFVPFSVGLELSRYLYIRRIDRSISAKRLLLALLLDRVLGLIAAVTAVALLALVVLPATFWQLLDARWFALAGLLVAAAASLALAQTTIRQKGLEVLQAGRALSVRLVYPTLLSFIALALVCTSVYVIASAAGWAVGLGQVTFAISAALLGMAIPLSLFGATLGEVTGVSVLALLGIAPAIAVLLVTVGYTWRLVSAMQGAALELRDGLRRGHTQDTVLEPRDDLRKAHTQDTVLEPCDDLRKARTHGAHKQTL